MTGIVLAGGRSSRFGSDKLEALHEGAPLLHHAVVRVAGVTDEVIVVAGPGALAPSVPGASLARIVRDAQAGQGPLEGALAGLEAAAPGLAFIVGGDMPALSQPVARAMLRAVTGDAEIDAAALRDGEVVRPLPLAVRVEAAREAARALRARGERRLRALPQALRTAVVDERAWHALDPARLTVWDVDEPEDLGRGGEAR